MDVFGSGFTAASVVTINQEPANTSYVSATHLQATPSSSQVASVGNYTIAVTDGGLTSGTLIFVVYLPAQGIQPFLAASGYFVGSLKSPAAVAVADLDGDGLAEVIINGPPTSSNSPTTAILKGQSNGSLAAFQVIPGVGGAAYAVGDVNGDGTPDIVAVIGGSFTVLLNEGKGNFVSGQTVSFNGIFPTAAVVADFMGSGLNDLIVGVKLDTTGALYLFPNQGNGNFGAPLTLASTGPVPTFAVADFNGDGKPDIAYSGDNDSSTGAHLLLNQGGGTFNEVTPAALANVAGCLVAGDFNNDELPDLVIESTAETAPITVQAFLNQGNAVFQAATSPITIAPAGANVPVLVAADFDRDGNLDIAGSGDGFDYPAQVLFLWGDGTGNFAVQKVTGPDPFVVAAGDINGDGFPDVVAPTPGNESIDIADVVLGNATRTFPQPYVIRTDAGGEFSIGDVDGDGYPDLFFKGDTLNQIASAVFLNQRNGTFLLAGRPSYWGVSLVDLNGDGKAELFGNEADTFMIWPGTGDPNYGSSPITFPAPSFAGSVGGILFADLDGDGLNDIVGPNYIGWNQGNFQFDFVEIASNAVLAIGDADGDGRPDLIAQTGTFLNQGNRQFTQVQDNGLPIGGGAVACLGDFNGDGVLDAALAYPGQSSGEVIVAFGRGDGTFYVQSYLNGTISPSGTVSSAGSNNISGLLVGDFNGDGLADIITPIQSTVQVLLYTNSGNGQFKTSYFVGGVDAFWMAAADLNNDGKLELILLPSQPNAGPNTAVVISLA